MSTNSRYQGIQKAQTALRRALFTLVFLLTAAVTLGGGFAAHAQTTAAPTTSWWNQIVTQVQAVFTVAARSYRTTFSAAVLDIFNPNQSQDSLDTLALTKVEESLVLRPRSAAAGGSLVFNTPVIVDDNLAVTGALTASTSRFRTLTATSADLTSLTATVAELADLVVQNTATLSSLTVTNQATIADLVVQELAQLTRLEVSDEADLADVTVAGTASFLEEVAARGGLATFGANIDLGDGELYAANVVNELVAGDNISITGTQNQPVVSVVTDDLVGVLSLNDETGELELEAGTDIRINGLEIINRSTLSSVASRGSCVNCITDQAVIDSLTINGGTINSTAIGMSSPSQATFTTTTVTSVLTVSSTATSTFAGSVNLTGGCFAVDGECIAGATPATYISLTDTPSSLVAGAIQFASSSGGFLTQSADLTFDGTNLNVGAAAGIAIGGTRMLAADTGSGSLFLGESAGSTNSGSEALLVGQFAGEFNSGNYATLLGYGSGGNNSGDYNTAVGYLAGYNLTGNENIVLGYQAANDMDGSYNVAIGSSAALQQTGNFNEFIGYEAGRNLQGSSTVLLGTHAMRGLGTDSFSASGNVALGYQAGYSAETGANDNILLGYRAGHNLTTGSRNIVIGYEAALPAAGTATNSLVIGNLIYGTGLDAVGTTTASGKVGIGTSSPSSRLTVAGDLYVTGAWRDGGGATGADGDFLISTGTSTTWADPAAFGLGDGTYLGLTDTPEVYFAHAIQYATSAANALTQASDFVYTGSRLGVGTDAPVSTVTVRGDISALETGALRLYDGANTHYVGLRASTSLSTTTVWTLPSADGLNNQLLVTDGDGNLSFADISAIGGGATTYLELTDTPSSYTQYSVPFVNATGTALTQDSNFVWRNERLGLGVNNPSSRLVVQGDVRFQISDAQVGMSYQTATNRFGFGTANPTDLVTVQGGSFMQRGGASGDTYGPVNRGGITLPAGTNDVAVVGDYAYAVTDSTGDDFHIIDISNPLDPIETASIPLPAGATAVQVAGQYAYVTTEVSGNDFHVIDISNPLDPVEVASVPLPTSALSVALQGRYAYVGTGNVGTDFHVIDISNPLVPFEVDAIEMDDSVNGIAVAGQYAYVATSVQGDDFHVIDISDPTNVVALGSIDLPSTANAVEVVGRFAYVVTDATGDDFHVIDVSDPLLPTEVGSVDFDTSANDVTVTGRYAYIGTQSQGDDIYVVDVLDPALPVVVGRSDLGLGNILGVTIAGRYAFLGSSNTGTTFNVIDITGAEVQSLVAQTITAGDLSVRGNAMIAGTLTGGLGVRAGIEGVQTDGALAVLGSSTSYIAGKLGVGTTTPSSKLTVAGTIKATNLEGGAVGLETDANGNIIRAVSDARLKENVSTIDGALEQLLKLRGVRYEWIDKDRFGTQTEIGFLAQEVDVVVPEVVRKGGEYWSLNTRNLLAVVVEAVKELWYTVQGNQAELEALRERVESLEAANHEATAPTTSDTPPVDEVTADGDESKETLDTTEEADEDEVPKAHEPATDEERDLDETVLHNTPSDTVDEENAEENADEHVTAPANQEVADETSSDTDLNQLTDTAEQESAADIVGLQEESIDLIDVDTEAVPEDDATSLETATSAEPNSATDSTD